MNKKQSIIGVHLFFQIISGLIFLTITVSKTYANSHKSGFVLSISALEENIDRTLEDIHRATKIGALHFNIPVSLCQKNENSNEVYFCNEKEITKKNLSTLTTQLRQKNYSYTIMAFLMSENGVWRGFFNPENFQTWSASYRKAILTLADWSNEFRAEEIIIASELSQIYQMDDIYWSNLLNESRLHSSAQTLIVANWDQFDQIRFWDKSDYIGLSAYYPLSFDANEKADPKTLSERWQQWADKLIFISKKFSKKLYFAELGYTSMQGSAVAPWQFYPPMPVDLQIQANLFEAFEIAWIDHPENKKYLERFMIWALDINHASDYSPSKDWGFSIFGKPAEKIVSKILQSINDQLHETSLPFNSQQ